MSVRSASLLGMCSFVVLSQAAFAQECTGPQLVKEATLLAAAEAPVQAALLETAPISLPVTRPSRPSLLTPLYSSYIGLQALDIHSTRVKLGSGLAREANPLVGSVADTSAGLIALKAASTAAVIYGSEKLWKKHRVLAVVAMVAVNSATMAIVARNYRVR